MKRSILILVCLTILLSVRAAPTKTARQIVFVPARVMYPPNMMLRGPFDFIGNWIQGSEWFPLEVNIPDTFGAVGNAVGNVAQGVGSFAQGVGNNINGLAQNVGQGFQTLSQNVGSGLQNVAQFFSQRPNGAAGTTNTVAVVEVPQPVNAQQENQPPVPGQKKYFILVPTAALFGNKATLPLFTKNVPLSNDILLDTFP